MLYCGCDENRSLSLDQLPMENSGFHAEQSLEGEQRMSSSMMEQEEKPVVVENQPTEAEVQTNNVQTNNVPPTDEHTWKEEIEHAGSQLVERVKELINEGNVRRLIISNAEGKVMLEVPLTAGVAVGGVVTILSPVLAALGALAALLARVKVEVVRAEEK